MIYSKAQIVATIGPASSDPEVLEAMFQYQLDVVRFNFSWGEIPERAKQTELIRSLSEKYKRRVPIIVDLPGPRIQNEGDHTYDRESSSAITDEDRKFIKFAAEEGVEYVAVSFVSSPSDIEKCREVIREFSGTQKVIAKIERKEALNNLEGIIKSADAIMVARGDLGKAVPLEKIPFIQERIVKMSKSFRKPVIVATEMLISMVENQTPTRAEVTDVANAILQGADAVMLSEETTIGKYPVLAVEMMERVILEAEKHIGQTTVNLL